MWDMKSYGMFQKVTYQSPICRRDDGWKGSGCWVEIVDAEWKQNIANKYCEILSVNSLHINILRHI